MALFNPAGFRMEGGDHIEGATVTDSFFRTLGVKPELGRTIEPEDGKVVVISHALWLARFAGPNRDRRASAAG
jgi:hypothetical protein